MTKSKSNLIRLATGIFFTLQIISAGAVISLSFPTNVQAAVKTPESLKFTPQVTIPNSDFSNSASTSVGTYDSATGKMDSTLLAKYISAIYNYGLAIAGILATIVLMGAGVIWLTSGGDSGKITQAKDLISGSIAGLVILVVSWVILNTVNPDLVNLKAIESTAIKNGYIEGCCSPQAGNIAFNPDESCPSSTSKCQRGQSCKNDGQDVFACIDDENYNCCQYQGTVTNDFDTRYTYCVSVPSDKGCSKSFATKDVYKDAPSGAHNMELTEVTKNLYCGKIFKNSKSSYLDCKNYRDILGAGACDGKSDSDECDVGGYCYNKKCYTQKGKMGEVCGDDGPSTCWAEDYCRDKESLGGRKCIDGLVCCVERMVEGIECTGTPGSKCKSGGYCFSDTCLLGPGSLNDPCGGETGGKCTVTNPNNIRGNACGAAFTPDYSGRQCESTDGSDLSCCYPNQ